MSLVASVLEQSINGVLSSMSSDDDLASGLGTSIFSFISSGSISGSIAGMSSAPPGSFSGSATGLMTVSPGDIESALKDVFEKMGSDSAKESGTGDDDLAKGLAKAIDDACKNATFIVSISGTVTMTSPPWSSPGADSGDCTWSGNASSLESSFKDIFKEMGSDAKKKDGSGDSYMAKEVASAITDYLTGASIITKGQSVLSGSSGTCSIS